MQQLEIKNLRVAIGENEIIRDLSLSVGLGEMHAVMGPNGSGKSTLAKVIAGHPDYKVTSGEVLMDGENLFELEADERARRGLFLAFQYPSEVPGVTIANFLRAAMQARLPEGEELEATDYYAKLYEKMDLLEIDRSFTSRAVNEGFAGPFRASGRGMRWRRSPRRFRPTMRVADRAPSPRGGAAPRPGWRAPWRGPPRA